jgi:uncharacterized protein YbjT (DUF2867 family)
MAGAAAGHEAAMRILVTGATGYIGGRLAPRLVELGHQVRCTTRDARRPRDLSWVRAGQRDGSVEIVQADATDPPTLAPALAGVDVAYYLIHSLSASGDFSDTDRRAAAAFAEAAGAAGVRRIIYLGGLGGPSPNADKGHGGGGTGGLSAHLASRREVGDVLLAGPVPTVALSAAVIIGSGSASFEMLRYLTERLPVMVTPRWVANRVQPIAIRDVLAYLTGCLDLPGGLNRRFDIGGPDILTYADMMRRFAAVEGLAHRRIVPVPVLSPKLSSYWVGLVTPVPAAIARPLVESLRNEVVCTENDIATLLPAVAGATLPFDEAVRLALRRVRRDDVATRWSGASPPASPSRARSGGPRPAAVTAPSLGIASDPEWSGGSLYRDERDRAVDADPAALWRVIIAIGGTTGWYSWPLAWTVRGWLDSLVGGVGPRRGRRDPRTLAVGEAVDFWRVEDVVPGHLLSLRAEMKLPGEAWLELRADDDGASGSGRAGGGTRYRQRALFRPRGLAGHLYWWALKPFHGIVFGGMARTIARRAEQAAAAATNHHTDASGQLAGRCPRRLGRGHGSG